MREHPGLTVWVSEIGAPHLVDPSRLERSARRLYGDSLRPALGRARARARARTSASPTGDVLGWEAFPTPGTPRTTSATCATARCSRATRAASGSSRVGTCSRSRRRPTSTSRPGTRTIAEIRSRVARAARADPLRRRDRRRRRTSTASTPSSTAGPRACATAWRRRSSSPPAAPRGPGETTRSTDASRRTDQSWQGLRRYWDKREAGRATRSAGFASIPSEASCPRGGGLVRRSTGRSTSPRARRRPRAAGRVSAKRMHSATSSALSGRDALVDRLRLSTSP